MAITRVQTAAYANSAGASKTASFPANVTAGNLIVVAVCAPNTVTVSSVTDSLGNTYQQAGSRNQWNGAASISIHYAYNVAGGTCTVTVTLSASSNLSFSATEYAGALTSSGVLDSTANNGATSTGPTVTVSASQAGDLLFAAFGTATGAPVYSPGPLQMIGWLNFNVTLVPGDVIVGAATTVGLTWPNATQVVSMAAATFKAASSGSGGGGIMLPYGGLGGGLD